MPVAVPVSEHLPGTVTVTEIFILRGPLNCLKIWKVFSDKLVDLKYGLKNVS